MSLYAFYQEHERGGDLDSAVADDRVWLTCVRRGDQSVRRRPLTSDGDTPNR